MKAVCVLGMSVVCGLVMTGSAVAAGKVVAPSAQEIADKHELIVAAIQGLNEEDAAAVVVGALKAQSESKLSKQENREHCIAIVTCFVVAEGKDAAPMAGIVAAHVPPDLMPVVAAVAVVASGDQSPAVAKAMMEGVDAAAPAAESLRSACANPSAVLSTVDMGIIRVSAMSAPAPALALAPTSEKGAGGSSAMKTSGDKDSEGGVWIAPGQKGKPPHGNHYGWRNKN